MTDFSQVKNELVQRFLELETAVHLTDRSEVSLLRIEELRKSNRIFVERIINEFGAVGKHNLGAASGFMVFRLVYECGTHELRERYLEELNNIPISERDPHYNGIHYQMRFVLGLIKFD